MARAISTSTSTGALIGTVAYLSPNSFSGKQADARSDIYSVGIMLYEMITGQQPFDGDVPIQVAYQHVNSTVGPPSALVPGLAGEIDELVQWCTANDPDKRPVDGNALLSELRHIRTNLSDAELDLQPPARAPLNRQYRTWQYRTRQYPAPPYPVRRRRPPSAGLLALLRRASELPRTAPTPKMRPTEPIHSRGPRCSTGSISPPKSSAAAAIPPP